jgi:putative membrane protein
VIRAIAALGVLLGATLLGVATMPSASAAPADPSPSASVPGSAAPGSAAPEPDTSVLNDPAPAPFVLPANPSTGDMTEADRIFLEKVRQAGLWEMPAGQMAEEKGTTETVRTVGRLIAADHAVLDDDVRRVSKVFGVPLPDSPTPEQQLWLDEMKSRSGDRFDATFAQRLRYAHGAVYSAIAQVRASSRNALMRAFAKQCEIFVHRHMSLLEATGDVTYDDLPLPVVARGNLRQAQPDQPLLLIALFAVTGALGVAGVARALRGAA